MIEKNLLKEVRSMAIGVFLLSLFMVLIFFLCGYFSIQVILGALLGDAVCVLNFLILAYCVSQAVEKGEDSAKKIYKRNLLFKNDFSCRIYYYCN